MKILIIGGNRFFGKKFVGKLLKLGHEVTLLNRGTLDDGFGNNIDRIRCDRKNQEALKKAVTDQFWDLVYDQVCFDANDANSAVEIFKEKTAHYLFTSSMSVYEYGENIEEEVFFPNTHKFVEIADPSKNYAEAKRQCEAVFFKNWPKIVSAIRFPLVIGTDDYTKRFSFHTERIREGKSIYFPNTQAKISMISSDDAASVLSFLASRNPVGPLNASAAAPILLADLIKTIELKVGRTAHLTSQEIQGNHSPYGIKEHWYLNTQKLNSLGLAVTSIQDWLKQNEY